MTLYNKLRDYSHSRTFCIGERCTDRVQDFNENTIFKCLFGSREQTEPVTGKTGFSWDCTKADQITHATNI